MVEVRTGFDPVEHGFRFTNSFHGGEVVGEMARQGRLQELTGLKVPRAVRHLTNLIEGEGFWGTFGLCGGMSWTALDLFRRGEPRPATASIPGSGSQLFSDLVERQADSMRGRDLLERCLVWQLLPDKAPWWMFWSKGIGRLTVEGEWPKLQRDLDSGAPTALTLIRAQGVTMPDKHHQVVATGYDLSGDRAGIHIYDPNHPGSTPSITIDLGDRSVRPRQSPGEAVRGFFVWSPD
ncbi:MAG TPA: hypothetical protein VF148_04265 [Acidimicrobiia bacterium]